jgi:hypothetical protein
VESHQPAAGFFLRRLSLPLPAVPHGVSVKEFGAKGDGVTDTRQPFSRRRPGPSFGIKSSGSPFASGLIRAPVKLRACRALPAILVDGQRAFAPAAKIPRFIRVNIKSKPVEIFVVPLRSWRGTG